MTSGQSMTCAPVAPNWRSDKMDVNSRSTVRRATRRPSAGAHIATGASTMNAGECTVHPIAADTMAIALVAPTDIAATNEHWPPGHHWHRLREEGHRPRRRGL